MKNEKAISIIRKKQTENKKLQNLLDVQEYILQETLKLIKKDLAKKELIGKIREKFLEKTLDLFVRDMIDSPYYINSKKNIELLVFIDDLLKKLNGLKETQNENTNI